jgi:hypothetical protein
MHIEQSVRRWRPPVTRSSVALIDDASSRHLVLQQHCHTAPAVARRVPFFLPRCDVLAVFEQPDAKDKEVVPKEPQALRRVSINDTDKLIAEPALLIHRPAPACVAIHQTSAKFDGINHEEVNPKLAAVFCEFWDEPGEPRFNAVLALYAHLLPLFCQHPLTPPLVYDQSTRPCYQAWPMLF